MRTNHSWFDAQTPATSTSLSSRRSSCETGLVCAAPAGLQLGSKGISRRSSPRSSEKLLNRVDALDLISAQSGAESERAICQERSKQRELRRQGPFRRRTYGTRARWASVSFFAKLPYLNVIRGRPAARNASIAKRLAKPERRRLFHSFTLTRLNSCRLGLGS